MAQEESGMLTVQDIIFLFDDLWPEMKYSAVNRDECLAQIDQINAIFQRHQQDFNELLQALSTIPGIGLVIGSGLIFSANIATMVPFDKYTTGWALELGIIPDNRISAENYVNYASRIQDYIRNSEHLSDIVDFVREARVSTQFPIAPE